MKCPILSVIFYFDIFDRPLRAEEIWKWLPSSDCSPKMDEVLNILKSKKFLKTVLEEDGFYFLKTSNNLLKTRTKRYRFAEKKYKRALNFAKIARLFPFVKMIAVCNDLGYSNAPLKSDIDLFIVTSHKRIWTARFFVTGFLKLFRLRPGEAKNNAMCPSFFVDENNLNLENLTLKCKHGKIADPHFIYWMNQMTPILDKDETYKKFRRANEWVKKFLPNVLDYKTSKRRDVVCRISTDSFFGDRFENLIKKYQLRILSNNIKKLANKNTNIVITDGILKFHQNDTREKVREKYYEKINRI
ncbi:MAG: hypothetical protein HQ536_02425 [Parcubacteria group bacterium]|nr:hypothetical protein [Parcubacteria group bacterium]